MNIKEILKNIILVPIGIVGTVLVLMFFYYFFLFFAYDLNPDFLEIRRCDGRGGTWVAETRECSIRPY